MTTYIIGAGIIGLSTAHALARAGQSVTVLEAQGGPAQGSSFAPTGLMSSIPPALWPSPVDLRQRLGLRTRGFPAMPVAALDGQQRRWAALRQQSQRGWLAESAPETPPPSAPAPSAAAHASQPAPDSQTIDAAETTAQDPTPTPGPVISSDMPSVTPPAAPLPPAPTKDAAADPLCVRLAQQLGLPLEHGTGHLILARREADAIALRETARRLQTLDLPGVETAWLDAAEVALAEPGLNPDTQTAGALRVAGDLVANCRQLAMALRAEAEWRGVTLRVNSPVQRLEPLHRSEGWRIVLRSGEQLQAARVVICAGAGAQELLAPLGLRLPLQAAHAYTLTAALREPINAPRHAAVTDATSQITITRQGQRVRVAGGYRLGAAPRERDPRAVQALVDALARWYPGAAALESGTQFWHASVLMTPDDEPIAGPAGQAGLWLNIGHGFHGWTQSLTTAYALARMMTRPRQD